MRITQEEQHTLFFTRRSLRYRIILGVFCLYAFIAFSVPATASTMTRSDDAHPSVHRPKNPVMRVLLGDALSPTTFTANGKFVIENDNGKVFFTVSKGEQATIKYKNGKYITTYNGKKKTAKRPLRATPVKYKKKITVENFENRPAWNQELNDNVFFGSVELVYSDNSGKAILVNELGIEKYVRGIAEATNNNDMAYLKALMTAARTYAYFHITHPTKHADEPYILNATANDQVYKGAAFTSRAPNIAKAQKKTKNMIIFHKGSPIIAPYFSQSDGRTRAWSEVWNGEYDWAQSVEDPGCDGLSLRGHGVGMSAEGARYFAEEKDWSWKRILRYYYQGVKIKKKY